MPERICRSRDAGGRDRPLRILMVTSEAEPYAKSGGLADAVTALSYALAERGHDVRVLLPRYRFIDRDSLTALQTHVPLGSGLSAELLTAPASRSGSEPVFSFLDNQELYGGAGIYASPDAFGSSGYGTESGDAARFSALCRAAFEFARRMPFPADIVHGHDWPGALIGAYRDATYAPAPSKLDIVAATVLTVHNGGYQGVFGADAHRFLALSDRELAQNGVFLHTAGLSFLKSGVVSSDAVTTVSPTYAEELRTGVHGDGLADCYRRRGDDFVGILNGMDYETWNPATDPHLPVRFTAQTLPRKTSARAMLRRELGLVDDPDTPLVAMVTRLADQKGIRELLEPETSAGSRGRGGDGPGATRTGTDVAGRSVLERAGRELPLQIVVLGTGESWAEQRLRGLADRLSGLSVVLAFDTPLAHRIIAGADFLLMPSRYEPCGLTQMYALRYGTVPIVTRTGGLADTVRPYDPATGTGTGLVMSDCSPREIYDALSSACRLYRSDPEAIRALRLRGMELRFDWSQAAARYESVYTRAIERRKAMRRD